MYKSRQTNINMENVFIIIIINSLENEPSPIDTFRINDKKSDKVILNNERPNTPTLGFFSPIENNVFIIIIIYII